MNVELTDAATGPRENRRSLSDGRPVADRRPPAGGDSRRVLVVDDSPTARRVTGDYLAGAGYDVVTAADGDDALRAYDEHQPDAVVLDIVMPKRNGFQVCRKLKGIDGDEAKIVMLTSKTRPSDREWGERQGCDAYLTKPVQIDELLDSLSQLLTRATAQTPTPKPDETP